MRLFELFIYMFLEFLFKIIKLRFMKILVFIAKEELGIFLFIFITSAIWF